MRRDFRGWKEEEGRTYIPRFSISGAKFWDLRLGRGGMGEGNGKGQREWEWGSGKGGSGVKRL